MNAVDQLCPQCGLCCDGTLFADVELRAGDNPKHLAKSGLSLKKKGKIKIAFTQPCACFDGTYCKIYADRPGHCRGFECGLLKKVEAGKMKAATALKEISKAKVLANDVRKLLNSFNGSGETASLPERYAQAMAEPADLSQGNTNRHGKLMRAYHHLMNMLQRDFLNH